MVGLPHSEILGSKLIRSSPRLIAAYYVLHRLYAPRHPLNALKALDRSHYQCPQRSHPSLLKIGALRTKNSLPIRSARTGLFPNLTVAPKGKPTTSGLIGQIKLTRNHVQVLFLPGVRVKRESSASLYDVERSGSSTSQGRYAAKLALSCDGMCFGSEANWWSRTGSNRRPEACKATALPTELRPHLGFFWLHPCRNCSKAGGPG
jgi:hypothetical protein